MRLRYDQLSFEQKLAAGRVVEEHVAAYMRKRGWWVVPSYEFSGKENDHAPKMVAPPGWRDLVLPDLQGFKDRRLVWLEVKSKTCCTLHHISNDLPVTGIAKRLYLHYQQVEIETGGTVYLLFVHEKENEIRGDALTCLRTYEHHDWPDDDMDRGGTIFWEFSRIPLWGSREELGLPVGFSMPRAHRMAPLVAMRETPQQAFDFGPPKRRVPA